MIWTSKPEFQTIGNTYYEAKIAPLRNGHNFFVTFRIDVANKTDKDLKIDWNKTRYIHNGRMRGVFVFKGINPKDIKNLTIPADIVPAGTKFSKVVAPYTLLALSPLRSREAEAGISPGILPAGENGARLVVSQNGKEIVETVTVIIRML